MEKTFEEIRELFWEMHPEFQDEFEVWKDQNDYPADIRCAFVDFVEYLRADNQITEDQSNNVTL